MCRHIEAAYLKMVERQRAGMVPKGFDVPALPESVRPLVTGSGQLPQDVNHEQPDELLLAADRLENQDYTGATALCHAILRKNPRHVGSLLLLGRIGLQTQDYDAAEKLFKMASIIDPGSQVASAGLAVAMAELGRRHASVAGRPLPS